MGRRLAGTTTPADSLSNLVAAETSAGAAPAGGRAASRRLVRRAGRTHRPHHPHSRLCHPSLHPEPNEKGRANAPSSDVLTTDEIRTLLARLDGESADAIESDELECKEWNQADHKASEKTLRETVVCLANYRGGVIVLGVADKKLTRADAIVGVPSSLDRNYLSKLVYDGTDPHIRVEIEELLEPGGRRIVVIHVPCGRPAIHTTTDGVGKIRVGKECKPLKGSLLPRQPFDRVVTITHLALVAPIALSLLVGALAFVATQGA